MGRTIHLSSSHPTNENISCINNSSSVSENSYDVPNSSCSPIAKKAENYLPESSLKKSEESLNCNSSTDEAYVSSCESSHSDIVNDSVKIPGDCNLK